jgi:3-hydroxybutyryl-CoA dehydrogenase
MKVAVVGVGLMGSQIGCEYALGGHEVTFVARSAERARPKIEHAFALAVKYGLTNEERAASVRARVGLVEHLDEAAEDTEILAESIPEELDAKKHVLAAAAGRMRRAILASNTSSIPLTRLGEACGAPERTVGVHYWNPPLLMPPVEIISGERTDRRVVERMRTVVAELGKEPILVKRDVSGFIWNRLQMALLREALWLVENDVADPRTVDQVVRSGLARRYRYTGPFETVALGGVEAWSRSAANIFPELSTKAAPAELERWLTRPATELEAAREARDRGLASELTKQSDA